MKKNTTKLLIIAGVAVAGYLYYKKMKSGSTSTSKVLPEDSSVEDKTASTTATTNEDGVSATAVESPSGQTSINLPGGVVVSPEQAKKLKGKLKVVANKALAKLKAKRAVKKAKKKKVSGFDNLPILF
jgi:hypothetical protein